VERGRKEPWQMTIYAAPLRTWILEAVRKRVVVGGVTVSKYLLFIFKTGLCVPEERLA
jgi:hypothetical protein